MNQERDEPKTHAVSHQIECKAWRVKAPPDLRAQPLTLGFGSLVITPPTLCFRDPSQAGEVCRSRLKKVWVARQVLGLRAGSLWDACTWRGRPWRI